VEGITSGEVVIEIISVTGQQKYLKTEPVTGNRLNRTINPDLPQGLYFLRVWSGNNHLTTKFLINK
jgi:hypothetical protein